MTGSPIQLDGNTTASFDALESALGTTEIKVESTPKVEKAPPAASVKKDTAEKIAATPEMGSFAKLEAATTPTPAVKAEKASGPETKAVDDKQTASTEESVSEEDTSAVKTLKLKVGPKGKEVEIPLDTKITVPVDGKDEEFTIQELKNIKSGETALQKRFTDLDKREQSFKADKEETERQLTTVLEAVIDRQDAGGAILELARIAGIDPAPIYSAMQKEIVGDLEKFFNMSEAERKAYLLEKENSFLKQNEKSLSERKKAEQANSELERQAVEMREALEVSDEWISKAEADFKQFPEVHKDWLKGAKPTKLQVIQLADAMKRHEMANNIMKAVDPVLAQDAKIIQFVMNELKGAKGVTLEQAIKHARVVFNRPEQVDNTSEVTDNIVKKLEQNKRVSETEDDDTSSHKAKPTREASSKVRSSVNWDD